MNDSPKISGGKVEQGEIFNRPEEPSTFVWQLAPFRGPGYDAFLRKYSRPMRFPSLSIDGIEMQEKRKTRGLRHLALRVRDVQVSQRFYERLFDMKVVWQPDPENVYLSTGYDNLALHQVTSEELSQFNLSQVH